MKHQVIEANENDQCHCCGRVHRKLFLVDGYWLGKTCAADYDLFRKWSKITDIVWVGWEKRYNKVAKMVHGGC